MWIPIMLHLDPTSSGIMYTAQAESEEGEIESERGRERDRERGREGEGLVYTPGEAREDVYDDLMHAQWAGSDLMGRRTAYTL